MKKYKVIKSVAAAETAALFSCALHHNRHGRRGRSLLRFNRHRECFRLDARRQRRIDYRRAPVSIGLEHSCGEWRAARRNQPELVCFLWGQLPQIASQEDQTGAIPYINRFALRLRMSLDR